MRMTLIIVQAAILTFLAVFGAYGDTGSVAKCPLSDVPTQQHCEP